MMIHHSAICTRDIDKSLAFWRDGLGFDVLLDERFEGDWATLLHARSSTLRSIFLGDSSAPGSGIVELVDLGDVPEGAHQADGPASTGFLLLSLMTDVESVLTRLEELGLGGTPRRVEVSGVAMAVVTDPDGVLVELIDTKAAPNLERLSSPSATT
jgi:glyoxylase I family protein